MFRVWYVPQLMRDGLRSTLRVNLEVGPLPRHQESHPKRIRTKRAGHHHLKARPTKSNGLKTGNTGKPLPLQRRNQILLPSLRRPGPRGEDNLDESQIVEPCLGKSPAKPWSGHLHAQWYMLLSTAHMHRASSNRCPRARPVDDRFVNLGRFRPRCSPAGHYQQREAVAYTPEYAPPRPCTYPWTSISSCPS